jgi:hypothetical protein
MQRRTFLKVGAVGVITLAGAGFIASRSGDRTLPDGFRWIDRENLKLLTALLPVILDKALPTDPAARAVALNDSIETWDRTISGMTPSVQNEIKDLFGLLTNPLTRGPATGVWGSWEKTSPQEVEAFLNRWRYSKVGLLRAGYQAINQLTLAGWYGNPLAWGQLGYIPPNPLT